jgi:hypothetical protein
MRIRAVALAFLLASSATASADGPIPIIGGQQATVGQFKTVVAVDLGSGLCTGTLISPNWVMTAGHCVTPSLLGYSTQAQVTANTTIFLDTITASGGKQVKALATMPHPMYNPNTGLNDDVGLIHLLTPVTDRTPVPLNRTAAKAPVGVVLEMVGFGVHTSGGTNAGVEYFLEGKTTYACANVGDPGALDTNLLCWSQQTTPGTITGKCEGDSGGPSFAMIGNQKFQVGITSVGWSSSSNQTACDGAGADTRVDHVMDWLDTTIGDEIKCAADGVCMPNCANDPDCPTCQHDSDCTGNMQVCDVGHCVPAPNTPGGLGSTCTMDSDCAAALCATVGTDKKCSRTCDTSTDSCPSGFDCLPTSTASGSTAGACWPGANGGGDSSCSASGGGAGASLFFVGFAVLFVARRKRR